jgi:hypothetical protein
MENQNVGTPSDTEILEGIVKDITSAKEQATTGQPSPEQNKPEPKDNLGEVLQSVNAQYADLTQKVLEATKGSTLTPEAIGHAVQGALAGLSAKQQDDTGFEAEQSASMRDVRNLVSGFQKQLDEKDNLTRTQISTLNKTIDNLQGIIVRNQLETKVAELQAKYPDMNKKEVMGVFVAANTFGEKIDLETIAKESHEGRTLKNILKDLDKVPDDVADALILKRIEKKKAAISAEISPRAGGVAPKYDDAVEKELLESKDPEAWDALEELTTTGKVSAERLKRIRESAARRPSRQVNKVSK